MLWPQVFVKCLIFPISPSSMTLKHQGHHGAPQFKKLEDARLSYYTSTATGMPHLAGDCQQR